MFLKNLLSIQFAKFSLFPVLLAVSVFFSAASCTYATQTLEMPVSSATIIPYPPTIEDIGISTITPTGKVAFIRLSPSKIFIPELELTVELSGRLTQSTLDLNTNISLPVGYLTIFPTDSEPAIIQEVKLSALSYPLDLKPSGGGGGSGWDNKNFWSGSTQSYQVKTPLRPGEMIQITVAVIFSEYVNVNVAVPLTIELIVEPTSTTPEG